MSPQLRRFPVAARQPELGFGFLERSERANVGDPRVVGRVGRHIDDAGHLPHPHEQTSAAKEFGHPGVSDGRIQMERGGQIRFRDGARGPSRARRHSFGRGFGAYRRAAPQITIGARGAQRAAGSLGSSSRRYCRSGRTHHSRHQHGGPRHRHSVHPAVREAGGWHVILTEFHESRRIDRQLFGRAGRQGDPGSYESIAALDDEIFRRFVNGGLLRLVGKGWNSDQPIPDSIERALRSYSQRAAERMQGRARRAALAEDLRVNRNLGFAGTE